MLRPAVSLAALAAAAAALPPLPPLSVQPLRLANVPLRLRPGAAQPVVYSATPLSLDVYGPSQSYMLDGNVSVAGDWDAVSLDMSPYGIPYNSFIYEEPQPASWAARVAQTLQDIVAAWRLPVVLQLPVTAGSCPPANASDGAGGAPSVNGFTGCSRCFDYSEVRNPVASFIKQAVINYQLYLSLAVNSTGALGLLQYGVDTNAYFADGCGAELDASYVAFLAQLYETLRQPFPSGLAIFPSFALETMMQAREGQACAGQLATGASKPSSALTACTKAGYAQLAGIPRDLFAFSATPAASLLAPGGSSPGFRPWYITLPVSVLTGTDADVVVVSATGMTTNTLALNFANGTVGAAAAGGAGGPPTLECAPIVLSNATYATSWLTMLQAALPAGRTLLVSWAAARDTLFPQAMACPCSSPLPILDAYCDTIGLYRQICEMQGTAPAACELQLKLRGQLGIRDLFGQPVQPLFNALQAARRAGL